ncbi:MAG: diguanylate cyclase [Gammaproteobacteria bacterium]|nr:diguanylate cyclase [Gammaproteobacteria bacterium]
MALLSSNKYEHRQIELAIEVLERAVENHTKWLQSVHESIICGLPVDKEIIADNAHENCKLGLWYYNEESDVFRHHIEFVELEEPHRVMHDAARELLQVTQKQPALEDYRAFIQKQQSVIQQLLKLKDKLVGTFHSFDSLTGAVNRDAFNIIVVNEQARVKRENGCCCLALIDIDHFKDINDRYGHVAGDHVLRSFALMIKQYVRKSDTFCRYGGEEFVILLTETSLSDAFNLIESIRKTIMATEFEISEQLALKIQFSAGVSECKPGDKIENCLARADHNLYQAKQAGRNQVVS